MSASDPRRSVEDRRLRVHQRLRSGEGPARASLDQVARQCERCPREPDQRHFQFLHEEPDRFRHVRFVGVGIQRPDPRDTLGVSDRLIQHGPASSLDANGHTDRGDRHHDVREEDRGIERHASERLQRELDHRLRVASSVEDVRGPSERAVLGQVPTRLTHEPHGGAVHGLTLERSQETVVRRGSDHLPRIRSGVRCTRDRHRRRVGGRLGSCYQG